MRSALPVVLLAAVLAARTLPLVAETLPVDPAHSHAEFAVHVLWFGRIVGRLDDLQGTLDLDRRRGVATVDVHVATATLRMDDVRYADWARGPDFFDAARHPQIRFVSQPFPLDRLLQGGDLEGILTLRGISRPVRFELLPQPCLVTTLALATAAIVRAPAEASSAPVAAAASMAGVPAGSATAAAAPAQAASPATDAATSTPAPPCRALARGSIERSRFGMTAHRFTVADRVELGLVLRLLPVS
jgi:polyisoprenoid-binding protein YceI